MEYLFPAHQERFEYYLRQDGTHPTDRERRALFYVFAGCRDLEDRIDHFYDFEDRMIYPAGFDEVDLTSSSRALVELAYNLYNNYPCGTIVELFACLDEQSRRLAVEAINLRFRINY